MQFPTPMAVPPWSPILMVALAVVGLAPAPGSPAEPPAESVAMVDTGTSVDTGIGDLAAPIRGQVPTVTIEKPRSRPFLPPMRVGMRASFRNDVNPGFVTEYGIQLFRRPKLQLDANLSFAFAHGLDTNGPWRTISQLDNTYDLMGVVGQRLQIGVTGGWSHRFYRQQGWAVDNAWAPVVGGRVSTPLLLARKWGADHRPEGHGGRRQDRAGPRHPGDPDPRSPRAADRAAFRVRPRAAARSRTGGPAVSRPSPALVSAALADDDALDDLARAWLPHVYAWCHRLGGPTVDAEDAAHEVLIIMCRRIAKVRTPEQFPSWLFGITRRIIANHRRRAWVRRWVPGPPRERADPAWGPDRTTEARRTADAVWRTLDALPAASARGPGADRARGADRIRGGRAARSSPGDGEEPSEDGTPGLQSHHRTLYPH